jgi:hypothetical protein
MENKEVIPPPATETVTKEQKNEKRVGHDCAGFTLYKWKLPNGDIVYV